MRRVVVRRLGVGTMHEAIVPEAIVRPVVLWGTPCTVVEPPVVAVCGAELRGTIVVMADPGIRQVHAACRRTGVLT